MIRKAIGVAVIDARCNSSSADRTRARRGRRPNCCDRAVRKVAHVRKNLGNATRAGVVKAKSRNLLFGITIAVLTALVIGGARIGRIDVWKILLALIGVLIFRTARERDNSKR
jgi:hypothetical protein